MFVHALNTVKRIPRTGSARPPPQDRLKLYGLYKQSMEGDVEGVMRRPEGQAPEEEAEREKWYGSMSFNVYLHIFQAISSFRQIHCPISPVLPLTPPHQLTSNRDAWSSCHSLSRTEAKRRYISTLISTMHKYASTTPEARELVAELEFVWDQIKSNPPSNSSSSYSPPGKQALSQSQARLQQQPSYASIGPEGARGRDEGGGGAGAAGLRMIRPVSEMDEEEGDVGDEFEEAGEGLEGDNDAELPPSRLGEGHSRSDYDVRNRKWRKRIGHAIFKMTTEIAALREQIEAKRTTEAQRRRGIWAWVVWLAWTSLKHVAIDAALVGIALLWARRRDDKRLEQGLRLLLQLVAEQLRRVRGVKRVMVAE